ncbi:hypothetical protein GCM10012280_32740 [Wenjunlia tyrosinilytica]|uniref:Uncharacterized protein n=1 Tax=Wenjunlia tyrosinilytica TaxID=1544741 RepID=A0A917ZQD0_9ACTN|nr:hypothetical protein GCM10012280_32740 [Wenjunlia tyrosinilytica]
MDPTLIRSPDRANTRCGHAWTLWQAGKAATCGRAHGSAGGVIGPSMPAFAELLGQSELSVFAGRFECGWALAGSPEHARSENGRDGGSGKGSGDDKDSRRTAGGISWTVSRCAA